MRFAREKPRHLLASLFYKLNRYLPLSKGAKLDLMLDLAWISNRLAAENAGPLGLNRRDENRFLHDAIKPTDRVLDIGCAGGDILAGIQAAKRVGIDYDPTLIAYAKAHHPEVEFVVGEAHAFIDGSEKFDVAILSHVLEHIDDPERFLASLKGQFDRIYIEVPDLEWTELNRLRIARSRQLIYTDNDHIAEFDRDELEIIFRELGFEVLDREFRYGAMRYWIR